MAQTPAHNMTRITGTGEQVISALPCRLVAYFPEAATTGTVTLRDSKSAAAATPFYTAAIGVPQIGVQISGGGDGGTKCIYGLTVQLSAGSDAVLVIWDTQF